MFSQCSQLAVRHLKVAQVLFVIVLQMFSIQLIARGNSQKEIPRSIISDDFIKNRPKSKAKATSHTPKTSRIYRLASKPRTRPAAESSSDTLQLGLTIWKLQPVNSGVDRSTRENRRRQLERIAKRVEADTQFHEGDLLRLSIESPRTGYLYVINRDWFADGTSGETNLIFPERGEDNRLEAGKLINIPAEDQAPFRASPKSNQAGELLTIVVTSSPLPLPLSKDPLPISSTQLLDWEERWGGLSERFEMKGGAGEARTRQERQAAKGTRQLTRDDPSPQTIYLVTPKSSDGLLFNLMLSYVR